MSIQRTKKIKRKAIQRGRKNNNYHTRLWGSRPIMRFWKP